MRTHLMIIGFTMLACGTIPGCVGQTHDPVPTATELTNAEPSAAQLIDRFLEALASKDPDALHRLRVTEAEYREILMPGAVPEGQPPRRSSKEFADFSWGLVDTKSRYYEQSLLYEYGGRQLRLKAAAYERGEKHFANHDVHEQLRLELEDGTSGAPVTLATGSIVEVAGRYKFASYIRH